MLPWPGCRHRLPQIFRCWDEPGRLVVTTADCSQLLAAHIPSSVTEMADDAFAGCKDMMFHVQPGSEAERFAREKGVNYTYQ